MAIETERRQSGVWTVLYQPDIPSKTIERYQGMFDYLGNVVINSTRFNAMFSRNMACFQTTSALAGPTNSILGREFGFKVDRQPWLQFSEKVDSQGSPQSGQNVLRIVENDIDSTFSIIDPACYLYKISYNNMPIAVGNQDFIERAMSELYSNGTGQNVKTKLFFPLNYLYKITSRSLSVSPDRIV